jgi:hypothetical protein
MQLVAYGAQDIYLTGQPQITFFKSVYRRHTNYAMESIYQTFNGSNSFGKRVSATISRNGDLLGRLVIEADMPVISAFGEGCTENNAGYCQGVGHALINNVEIEIGGSKIDKHYGLWMEVWSMLTLDSGKEDGYSQMVGHSGFGHNPVAIHEPFVINNLQDPTTVATYPQTDGGDVRRLYIPLQFWFCRNPGLALPLVALQYHEIKLHVQFEELQNLLVHTYVNGSGQTEYKGITAVSGSPAADQIQINSTKFSSKLYCEYYFLDTVERRKFAQNAHEYLIEQVQFAGNQRLLINTSTTQDNIFKININHPTKQLFWVHQRKDAGTGVNGVPFNDFTREATSNPLIVPQLNVYQDSPLRSGKLVLNGQDRFSIRAGEYFRLVQSFEHNTRIPNNYIYSYSFALRPEEHQPSGACNFSRIDNAQWEFSLEPYASTKNPVFTLYGLNYNVLRIMSGMAGLAYSN